MATIRAAKMADLDRVVHIVQEATRHMDACGIMQWDAVYPNRAILQADIKNRSMHVIENNDSVAGLVVLNEEEPPEYKTVAWQHPGRFLIVHRLTIHPAFQDKKYATRLMQHAEDIAAADGYDVIRLDAFTKNPSAVALYEGRGYSRAGIVQFRKGPFFCYEKSVFPNPT